MERRQVEAAVLPPLLRLPLPPQLQERGPAQEGGHGIARFLREAQNLGRRRLVRAAEALLPQEGAAAVERPVAGVQARVEEAARGALQPAVQEEEPGLGGLWLLWLRGVIGERSVTQSHRSIKKPCIPC